MTKDGKIPLALAEKRMKRENPMRCVFKTIYKVTSITLFFPTAEENLGEISGRAYLVEFVRNADGKLNKHHIPVARAMGSQMP